MTRKSLPPHSGEEPSEFPPLRVVGEAPELGPRSLVPEVHPASDALAAAADMAIQTTEQRDLDEKKPYKRVSEDPDLVEFYLDDIGRHELLTKEDEVRLAQLIEARNDATYQLAMAKDQKTRLSPSKRRELYSAKRDGEEAFRQFVNSNLRLVVSIAKKYQVSGMHFLDIVQSGNIGLIRAVEKFDWRRGFKFSTYASNWIKAEIRRGIQESSRTVRLPANVDDRLQQIKSAQEDLGKRLGRTVTNADLAAELGTTAQEISEFIALTKQASSLDSSITGDTDSVLGDLVSDETALIPFREFVVEHSDKIDVERLLNAMEDAKERRVIELLYGLDGNGPKSTREVAAILEISHQGVTIIERRVLQKLAVIAPDLLGYDRYTTS